MFAATAFSTTGLVNGDTVSSVTETSTGSGATAAVGAYTIVPGAATFSSGLSSNYTITYASGTLTVNPAPLTITANNDSTIFIRTDDESRLVLPNEKLAADSILNGTIRSRAALAEVTLQVPAGPGLHPGLTSVAAPRLGCRARIACREPSGTRCDPDKLGRDRVRVLPGVEGVAARPYRRPPG